MFTSPPRYTIVWQMIGFPRILASIASTTLHLYLDVSGHFLCSSAQEATTANAEVGTLRMHAVSAAHVLGSTYLPRRSTLQGSLVPGATFQTVSGPRLRAKYDTLELRTAADSYAQKGATRRAFL